MPTVTDFTAPAALVVALAAAWYSRRSSIASSNSAATAQRALELSQGTRPLLTDASGGHPRIALADGCLTFWLTNGGRSGLAIKRIDLVSRAESTGFDRWLYPRDWRMGYARNEHIREVARPLLRGDGPDGGANVSEIRIPLKKSPSGDPPAPHTWGRGIAPRAPNPAQAILDRDVRDATIAIEIWTEALVSGSRDQHTVEITVGNVGRYVGMPFLGPLKNGTIVLKKPRTR